MSGNVSDFQFNQNERGIQFIGQPRKNNYIPGYLFKVQTDKDFEMIKAVMSKCLYESGAQGTGEGGEYDEDYFGQQLESEFANKDVDMADLEKVMDDFDFEQDSKAEQQ